MNKLGRAVTKWTNACDKLLARLISYIHHTCEFKQNRHVGNTAQQCIIGLHQDSDFAGDLEDSNSTSGRILCIFGSRTFVPIRWMCKTQTSVSHSSAEAELLSLDAGLRMGLSDLSISFLTEPNHQIQRSGVTRKPVAEHRTPHEKPKSNQARQSGSE